mgnify:FL=1
MALFRRWVLAMILRASCPIMHSAYFYGPIIDNRKEYFGNWTLSVDADPVFFSAKSAYALNLYRNTGEPLAKMYKRFDPPRMLPTEPLLKHVIGSPN